MEILAAGGAQNQRDVDVGEFQQGDSGSRPRHGGFGGQVPACGLSLKVHIDCGSLVGLIPVCIFLCIK